jgi:hypothetical protein
MAKASEMTKKELVRVGVHMFQASCYESSSSLDPNGQVWWSGKTCDGGGAYTKHRLNQDTMTPAVVAMAVGHREFLNRARILKAEFNNAMDDAAMSAYQGRI